MSSFRTIQNQLDVDSILNIYSISTSSFTNNNPTSFPSKSTSSTSISSTPSCSSNTSDSGYSSARSQYSALKINRNSDSNPNNFIFNRPSVHSNQPNAGSKITNKPSTSKNNSSRSTDKHMNTNKNSQLSHVALIHDFIDLTNRLYQYLPAPVPEWYNLGFKDSHKSKRDLEYLDQYLEALIDFIDPEQSSNNNNNKSTNSALVLPLIPDSIENGNTSKTKSNVENELLENNLSVISKYPTFSNDINHTFLTKYSNESLNNKNLFIPISLRNDILLHLYEGTASFFTVSTICKIYLSVRYRLVYYWIDKIIDKEFELFLKKPIISKELLTIIRRAECLLFSDDSRNYTPNCDNLLISYLLNTSLWSILHLFIYKNIDYNNMILINQTWSNSICLSPPKTLKLCREMVDPLPNTNSNLYNLSYLSFEFESFPSYYDDNLLTSSECMELTHGMDMDVDLSNHGDNNQNNNQYSFVNIVNDYVNDMNTINANIDINQEQQNINNKSHPNGTKALNRTLRFIADCKKSQIISKILLTHNLIDIDLLVSTKNSIVFL
jgi:hypothetical protein